MAKENIYDTVLAKTLTRVEAMSDRISENFKGVKPFGKEEVSSKEAMLDFDDMMRREEQLRQAFGDAVVDAYKRGMAAKLRKTFGDDLVDSYNRVKASRLKRIKGMRDNGEEG